jgi:hypothetical protein
VAWRTIVARAASIVRSGGRMAVQPTKKNSPIHQRNVASVTHASKPLSRLPSALASAIGASAGRDEDSSPLAEASRSSTAGSSRCSTPSGSHTARASRRCSPVAIAAEQYAASSASTGLRSSDNPYARVPTVSASNSECPAGEPSPCTTAGGILPTARPSATSATIGKKPSASTYNAMIAIRRRLVSVTSRTTSRRGDAASLRDTLVIGSSRKTDSNRYLY